MFGAPATAASPVLSDARQQLQRWAARRLLELQRDSSPLAIHGQLLRGAIAQRGAVRSKPEWWKLVVPPDEVSETGVRLPGGVQVVHVCSLLACDIQESA